MDQNYVCPSYFGCYDRATWRKWPKWMEDYDQLPRILKDGTLDDECPNLFSNTFKSPRPEQRLEKISVCQNFVILIRMCSLVDVVVATTHTGIDSSTWWTRFLCLSLCFKKILCAYTFILRVFLGTCIVFYLTTQ